MSKFKFSKESSSQAASKVLAFMKKNVYFILMIICVLALATVITIAAVNNSKHEDVNNSNNINNEEPNTNLDEKNENKTNVEENKKPPVEDTFVMASPIDEYSLGTLFSNTQLVWNPTQLHFATHEGVDYMSAAGSDVKCAYDGTIKSVTEDSYYGTTVIISHKNGYETVYKLLDKVKVKQGDKVKKGDVIGVVSESALAEIAQGPHLHFELIKDGKRINPMDYMIEGDK